MKGQRNNVPASVGTFLFDKNRAVCIKQASEKNCAQYLMLKRKQVKRKEVVIKKK